LGDEVFGGRGERRMLDQLGNELVLRKQVRKPVGT
jgi:hypothetical protein